MTEQMTLDDLDRASWFLLAIAGALADPADQVRGLAAVTGWDEHHTRQVYGDLQLGLQHLPPSHAYAELRGRAGVVGTYYTAGELLDTLIEAAQLLRLEAPEHLTRIGFIMGLVTAYGRTQESRRVN